MGSRRVRMLRVYLSATICVAIAGGGLALSNRLLDTSYWPTEAEYGKGLLSFAALCYFFRPEGNTLERWELIGIPTLCSGIWLMVIAAFTNPEGILGPITVVFLFVGLAYTLYGTYYQWANPCPPTSRQ